MLSPAATEIEAQTVRWIAELIGYPDDCGGLLVSGGNMANFVGFFAARAAKAPWKSAREGAASRGRAAAARLRLGRDPHLDPEGGRPLRASAPTRCAGSRPTPDLRMDVAALRTAIAADRDGGRRCRSSWSAPRAR